MDIYYKNRYNKGHEQREKRPYFVIYEGKDFFLAFPQTTKNKKGKKYPSHKNYIISEENEAIEIMIDQLQVVPKVQVLENNRVGGSLALALQKASIPRPISAHRVPLINHFLEQVISQSQSDENKSIKPIAFGSLIKLNPHNNENPLFAFIALSCTQFHYSGMRLVAPYENDSIIFELLH
ncbi:type II toxin-antitoxin system PemK/MazF family toxin [Helicobacter pylori]|uniref:type II toxin-antitoxin system PemK/MazF family toxin n=1 Tax=Helicobacter pylori TaxID=210 RepID=UPI001F094F6B|nr:hypothetical protein [Helicobacter pylori]